MGAIRGPGGREGDGGREVEDWRMFFFVFVCRRGLHGCMVAPSASRCARPGKAEEIFFGASGGQLRGWW